jgi:trimeric autotransporter adhesin
MIAFTRTLHAIAMKPFPGQLKHRRQAILASWVFLLCIACSVSAQPSLTPRTDFWRSDGPVNAIATQGNLAYVGGDFTYVGPGTGPAGVVSPANGSLIAAFPDTSGSILTVISDGQGGHYVGGKFRIGDHGPVNLVHVFPDRTLDNSWTPNPNNTVRTLLLNGDHLFVGGEFTKIGTITRNRLARFDRTTGLLTPWNPGAGGVVNVLLSDANRLYVGGQFNAVGGQQRSRLAALDPLTGAVSPWNPGASGPGSGVRALALAGEVLYVGGEFTTCGGKPRNRLAALDTTLNVNNATAWNPNANDSVNSVLLAGTTLYAGGEFTSVGGLNRNRIAALDRQSGLAVDTWNADANGTVFTLTTAPDGLYAGGQFTEIRSVERRGVARLDSATGTPTAWAPSVSSLATEFTAVVFAVLPSSAEVVVAGNFASLGGFLRQRLAALNLTSGVATEWNPGANREVYALAVSDTQVYAGGAFTNLGGSSRLRLGAVDRNTGVATGFVTDVTATANGGVFVLQLEGDDLYVGGLFTKVNGQNRENIARVDPTSGALDAPWNPVAKGAVDALLMSDAGLWAAGDFTSIGGSNRVSLALLSTTAPGRATAFNARADERVRTLALKDGVLYAGGDFNNIGGLGRRRLAALDPTTGAAAPTWNPDIGGRGQFRVRTLSRSSRILYVGGLYTAAGSEFRTNLAGINPSTGVATAWNPTVNDAVNALVHTPEAVLMGGEFHGVNGELVQHLAAFSTAPTIPSGRMKILANGHTELTVFDGDGSASELVINARNSLQAGAWSLLLSTPVTGNGQSYEDAAAGPMPLRFYQAVAR